MTKKFSFFMLAALMIVCTQSHAQVKVALGLKAGPNFSKLDVNSSLDANYKSRTGWHGGAFFLIKGAKVGVQPEFLFSRQGSKFTFNNQNLETNFDYINIPVVIKLYTVLGINLQVGPQLSFLSSAGGKAIDNSTSAGTAVNASKDLYKSSDLGAVIGVGWDLPLGIMLEGRYNLGLSKIQDNPNIDATKNRVFMVSLGYKLVKFGK